MPRENSATPTLIGLPYDASSSFLRGAAAAPPVIRQALHSPAGNPWTETGVDIGGDRALADMGDVPLGGSSAEVRRKIEEALRTLLDRPMCRPPSTRSTPPSRPAYRTASRGA